MNLRRVEEFLFHEASLMDEHRYSEWLALWDDDGVYWVPTSYAATDPNKEVSIIYDDRSKIADRVEYLESGTIRGEKARPFLRRVVGNIQVIHGTQEVAEVESNFVLIEARDDRQFFWAGRSFHRLRDAGTGIKIASKKVLLTNCKQPMSTLQFLI
jgi:benzoate/toluate 1,2-dioxygenase beta subunit